MESHQSLNVSVEHASVLRAVGKHGAVAAHAGRDQPVCSITHKEMGRRVDVCQCLPSYATASPTRTTSAR